MFKFITDEIDSRFLCIEQLANVIKTTIVTKWVHNALVSIADKNHLNEDSDSESIIKIENMLESLKYFYCNSYDIFDFSQDYYKKNNFFNFLGRYMKECDTDYVEWFVECHLIDKLEIMTDEQLWQYLDVRPVDLLNRFFGSKWYEEYINLWYSEIEDELYG